MPRRILIINPNSDVAMTRMLDVRLGALRFGHGPDLVCVTLEQGPPAIETMEHCRQVVAPLCDLIEREHSADAFVIGCFSDPGLSQARARTAKPVFGFCETGVAAALALGGRYGILTNLEDDIADELAYLRASCLDARLAGIEAAGIPVSQLASDPQALEKMIRAARRLAARGANAVVLGCAGFSAHASTLGEATGITVVDPVTAAAAAAIAATAS